MLKKLGRSVFIMAAVALPILTWESRSLAQSEFLTDSLSITVENFTRHGLLEFYVSPTVEPDDWGENRLETDILPQGETQEIVVDDNRDDCFYDVRGVFDNGQVVDEYQIDLCIDEGTYSYYDDDDRTFNIENSADSSLLEIYFTPVSQDDWGEDLLGTQELPVGDTAAIPVDSSQCLYDFKGVFSDGREEIVRAIDVCSVDGANIGGPVIRFSGGASR